MAEKTLQIQIILRDLTSGPLTKMGSGWRMLRNLLSNIMLPLRALEWGFRRLNSILLRWPTLIAGAGLGLIAKSFVDAASAAEQYRVRLTTLLGSQKEATKLFQDLVEYAMRVPKTYQEIMESAATLAAATEGGAATIKRLIPIIVDISAAFNLKVEDVTRNIIAMWEGALSGARLFRHRGVLAMMGFAADMKVPAEKARAQIVESWEKASSKFRDSSKMLFTTWSGLVSNMQDMWFYFRNMVMDAGLFTFLKGALKGVMDYIYKLKEEGKLEEFAASLASTAISAIETVILALGELYDLLRKIIGLTQQGWGTLKFMWDKLKGNMLTARTSELNSLIEAEQKEIEVLNERIKKEDELGKSIKKWAPETLEGRKRLLEWGGAGGRTQWELDIDNMKVWVREHNIKIAGYKNELNAIDRERRMMEKAEEDLFQPIPGMMKTTDWGTRLLEMLRQGRAEMKVWEREAVKEREKRQYRAGVMQPPFAEEAGLVGTSREELTAARASATFGKELLQSLVQNQYKTIEEYIQKRTALVEKEHAIERAALQAEMLNLGTHGEQYLNRKAELRGKIVASKMQERTELLQVTEEANRLELQQLEELHSKELIDDITYFDRRRVLTKTQRDRMLDLMETLISDSIKFEREETEEAAKEQLKRAIQYKEAYLLALQNFDVKAFTDLVSAHLREQMEAADNIQKLKDIEERGRGEINEIRAEIIRRGLEEIREIEYEQLRASIANQQNYRVASARGDIVAMASLAQERVKAEYAVIEQGARERNASETEMAEIQEAKMVEMHKAKLKEIEEYSRRFTEPLSSFFGDLGTVFEAFYESTGKKSREWARAMQAMQIATGVVDSLAAGIKAYVAAYDIPYVGQYLAPVMMTTAIAAGMAKVAMMQAQKFAGGGLITKGTGAKSDDVLLRGSRGEFMQPADAVRYYGTGAMEAIRKRMVPRGVLAEFSRPSIRGFATGGLVGGDASQATGRGGALNVINIYDKDQLGSYLASRPGETMLLNVLAKNAHVVRSILR